jgi:hypothetical protein
MKYAAAILMALALAGTGWAIVAATRPMPGGAPAADASPELNQQLKSCDGELLHLRGLEKTLGQVNRLTGSTQPPPAMLALYAGQPQTSAADKQDQSAKPKQAVKHNVSLVYISSDLQKVVIDGKLLGAGDMLPGVGRLIEITQEQVVVEQRGHRRVLKLPKPHVLGVASNSTNVR